MDLFIEMIDFVFAITYTAEGECALEDEEKYALATSLRLLEEAEGKGRLRFVPQNYPE